MIVPKRGGIGVGSGVDEYCLSLHRTPRYITHLGLDGDKELDEYGLPSPLMSTILFVEIIREEALSRLPDERLLELAEAASSTNPPSAKLSAPPPLLKDLRRDPLSIMSPCSREFLRVKAMG